VPKLTKTVPKYRLHKPTGTAVVTLDGQDIRLGPWKSRASIVEYERAIAEYLANGRHLHPKGTPAHITVGEVIDRFWDHAQNYYRSPTGKPTSEIWSLKSALSPLNQLYGLTPACDFGPLSLKVVRNAMIKEGWCRRTVNNAINRLRLMFNWAVGEELIPASILEALKSVDGLRAGRTNARETAPIQPVSDEVVNATLPFLSATVGTMIRLQRLTGARPGEICSMRTGDIDRSKPEWEYVPRSHKNSYRGQARKIQIGRKGQEILSPYLLIDPDAYCFSPAKAERERRQALHAKRRTPLNHGNRPGTNRRRKPKRAPGECYTVASYRAAITRACEQAFQPAPPLGQMEEESFRAWKRRLTPDQKAELRKFSAANHWHPHQLRHARANEVRRDFGLEGGCESFLMIRLRPRIARIGP
jgi:integrase